MSEDKKIKDLVESARQKKEEAAEELDVARPIEDSGSRALSESLKSSFLIIKIIVVFLVIIFLRTLFFTVGSQETAVILRFGKPVQRGESIFLQPGAHLAFPYPIDEVIHIPMEQVQTAFSSSGWYQTHAIWDVTQQDPPALPSLNPSAESYTLTSDTNIIHVRATLNYRIVDPEKYVFNFASVTNVVQNALDSALYHASAQFTADQALRLEKRAFEETITAHVQRLANAYDLGIVVEPRSVESIPPRILYETFDQAQVAAQESDTKLQEARAEAENSIQRANAQAAAIRNTALSKRDQMVARIKSEAETFQRILPEYRKAPEFFKERYLLAALRVVSTNVYETWLLPSTGEDSDRELRLLLSRPPRQVNENRNEQ